MSILPVHADRQLQEAEKAKNKNSHKITSEQALNKLKKAQHEELKQALKEAILISRGEMDGIPISELWDE